MSKNNEDLLTNVSSSRFEASCKFVNLLPEHYKVDIVQIGCKFIDRDGTNSDRGDSNTRIEPGEEQVLYSGYSGCCKQYVMVMKARSNSTGREWNFFNTHTVQRGKCGLEFTYGLKAKKTVNQFSVEEEVPFEVVLIDE